MPSEAKAFFEKKRCQRKVDAQFHGLGMQRKTLQNKIGLRSSVIQKKRNRKSASSIVANALQKEGTRDRSSSDKEGPQNKKGPPLSQRAWGVARKRECSFKKVNAKACFARQLKSVRCLHDAQGSFMLHTTCIGNTQNLQEDAGCDGRAPRFFMRFFILGA